MKSAPMVPTRSQLVALCRMLNMPSLGPTYYLRAKLRLKCQQLRADDRYLAGEGIDALTVQELHAACFERGMSLVDVTTECLQAQLQQWIDLHHVKRTPSIDLLVSNACALHERHRSVKQQQVEERNALQQLPACYLPSDLQVGLLWTAKKSSRLCCCLVWERTSPVDGNSSQASLLSRAIASNVKQATTCELRSSFFSRV